MRSGAQPVVVRSGASGMLLWVILVEVCQSPLDVEVDFWVTCSS